MTVPMFRHPTFPRYFVGQVSSQLAYHMLVVAVGWQIYDLTNSALALGLAFWTNAGLYSAAVSNPAGGSASAPAIVNVAPVLFSALDTNLLTLTWGGAFTLQSATNAAGPFADLPGVTSPFAIGATGPLSFFRRKSEPFALVLSNQSDGTFNLSGAGIPGYNFLLQSSTNLMNWVTVATNPSPFSLSASNNAPQTFYRAVLAR